MSVGFAIELNNFLPANTTSSTSGIVTQTESTTVTGTAGSGPGNCPAATNRTLDGYRLALYTPLIANAGDDVCIFTSFTNLSNQSVSPPTGEVLTVRNSTFSAVFLQATCLYSGASTGFGPSSPAWDCSTHWNTAVAYNGLVATKGSYSVWVTVNYSWEATPAFVVGMLNLRSTAGNQSTTSTSHSATQRVNGSGVPTCVFLNSQIHVLFPPLQQSGPVYLKVVTDQGSLVRNGTVFATHQSSASSNRGSADYCISLSGDTNSTGFMQISDTGALYSGGDGLPLGGAYNFTVTTGYDGKSFQVAVPQIVVHSGVITYVTISVPSDEVTEVTVACQGSSCSSATVTITSSGRG